MRYCFNSLIIYAETVIRISNDVIAAFTLMVWDVMCSGSMQMSFVSVPVYYYFQMLSYMISAKMEAMNYLFCPSSSFFFV